ncbi:rubrerythrin [Anaerococcus sp. Marseille-Q7828]|uniref:rubrerythrin n=1 Tax=Anaerococcus sp. Marseille-Q7828 TaxID=3036300 RepID=UPI0024AD3290|nr:rubrerythrin family protein [Anaerococcus sp. Marseille-Q7828]
MTELKGTKTAQNLITSFVGECQANMRYTYAAKTAKKEGYVQISRIFEETAMNEREHAARFYKFLKEEYKLENIELNEEYTSWPVIWHDTATNLQGAIDGENDEAENMYPSFADVAEEEGFPEIARAYRHIAKAEEAHRNRYQKLKDNIDEGKVFKKDEKVVWMCGNCGYLIEAYEAPKICPACAHGQEYFEVARFNY